MSKMFEILVSSKLELGNVERRQNFRRIIHTQISRFLAPLRVPPTTLPINSFTFISIVLRKDFSAHKFIMIKLNNGSTRATSLQKYTGKEVKQFRLKLSRYGDIKAFCSLERPLKRKTGWGICYKEKTKTKKERERREKRTRDKSCREIIVKWK